MYLPTLIVLALVECVDSKATDLVTALPGQPGRVEFSQFAGSITVDAASGTNLFYYLAEAEHPSKSPLLLWLNGGIGIGMGWSSVRMGAFTEIGPFRVNPDGKSLRQNPYAWNAVANVLFLDSPAGVGFSFSKWNVTDERRAAVDSLTFLSKWLDRFPEYKGRELFIAGEGYAGHFIPQLAFLILQSNINLQGIALGNPYLDMESHNRGTHGLISDEIHQGLFRHCNFTASKDSDACSEWLSKAQVAAGDIDGYNIYSPICSDGVPKVSGGFDPCSIQYVTAYLNSPEVQRSIHANTTGQIHGDWESYSLLYWQDSAETVLPLIKDLSAWIRVWIYRYNSLIYR